MPSGPRIRTDNVYGTVTDDPLGSGATTLNSAGLANLAAVSSAHAIIVLDPLRASGAPEIVVVTAHTASATSATITRAAYGTTARQHDSGTLWVHAPTREDLIRIVTASTRPSDPFEGQLVYETDTNRLALFGATDWAYVDAGGSLGYAEVTSSQGTFTSETDLTGLSKTVTVPTGRRVRVTSQTHPQSSVASDNIVVRIKESTTNLEEGVFLLHQSGRTFNALIQVCLTPSAGSHTYKVSMARIDGTGNITNVASSTQKSFILVEDIGAA